jgi:glycosyltransferase involved in cell wall biosynthesis
MATYNGQQYIAEQIDSILPQLLSTDELIVCDDASSDATVKIAHSYSDPRIKIVANASNIGHARNFERAIQNAKGEVIFLSDQDDVWVSGRVEVMLSALILESQSCVVSMFGFLPDPLERGAQRDIPFSNAGVPLIDLFRLIAGVKVSYFGCCMAFRRSLLHLVLPFPRHVDAHDHWISVCALVERSICYTNAVTLNRRIHDANVSSKKRRSLWRITVSRVKLSMLVIVALYRLGVRNLSGSKTQY